MKETIYTGPFEPMIISQTTGDVKTFASKRTFNDGLLCAYNYVAEQEDGEFEIVLINTRTREAEHDQMMTPAKARIAKQNFFR